MGAGFSGLIDFYRGRFEAAQRHTDHMLSLEAGPAPEWYIHDTEPQVLARACGCMTAALRDRPEAAEAMADEAIRHGRRSRNPFNLAFALQFAGLAFYTLERPERVAACGEEGLEVCAREGYPALIGLARVLRAWGDGRRGDPSQEVAAIQQGVAEGSRVRALIEGPRVLGILAEAQQRAGDPASALAAAQAGLRVAERAGNRFWDAELLRRIAELDLALRGDAAREAARARLLEARRTARAQGTPLLARRAEATLSRHSMACESSEP
jgi:hypothetical protein